MKKIAGDCDRDDRPAIHASENEVAVTVPRHLIEEAARALGR